MHSKQELMEDVSCSSHQNGRVSGCILLKSESVLVCLQEEHHVCVWAQEKGAKDLTEKRKSNRLILAQSVILCSLGVKLKFHTWWNNKQWYNLCEQRRGKMSPNLAGSWAQSLAGMKPHRFTSAPAWSPRWSSCRRGALHSSCGWILHSSESIMDFLTRPVRPWKSV